MKLTSALVLAFSAVLVSANGCNKGIPSNYKNTTEVTLSNGRQFYYHLPAGYSGHYSKAVYFSFHGAGKDALEQEGLSGFSDPYFNSAGIAVYPQGEIVDGSRYWLSHPGLSEDSPNDIDFVLEILDWLDDNLCINKANLYAAGKSNGGGLVNLLACNATTASTFAAFAGVSGAYYEDKLARNCNPQVVVPFISFHGLNDTTIPYTGKNQGSGDPADETTYPIDDWLKGWVARNTITTAPVNKTGLYDGLVTRSSWSRSGYSNVVIHYKENNLGHVWPSTLPNDDCPSPSPKCPLGHYTYNATTVIMNFFSQWHRPVTNNC